MSDVEITNIKAIKHLSFDLPGDGSGVIVLTGRNGAGKTTAIAAVAALLGVDDQRMAVSRGEEVGEVVGLGRKLRIGKKQTVTGESQVNMLHGVDLSVIVDPRVEGMEARNKYRIRELVSLGGRSIDPAELVADCVDYVDVRSAKAIDDPIKMADFLKRGLESAAREKEKSADVKAELAKTRLLEAGDVDQLENVRSAESLAECHRASLDLLNKARDARKAFVDGTAKNEEIDRQISKLEEDKPGRVLSVISSDLVAANIEATELEQQLSNLRTRISRLENERAIAVQHERSIQVLVDSVVMLDPDSNPTDESISELEKAEKLAYQSLVSATDVQRRSDALKASKELQNASSDLTDQADVIRLQIKSLTAKVQELLPDGPLRIENGELVLAERNVPFDELSEGERWLVALSYAIEAVGLGGVIPICQEAWQSLAPSLKSLVLSTAKSAGVVVITAQVDDGELCAVEFEG